MLFSEQLSIADYLISEMSKEGIVPVEFDEDLLLTPDVRDMMEMEVHTAHVYSLWLVKICWLLLFTYHNLY